MCWAHCWSEPGEGGRGRGLGSASGIRCSESRPTGRTQCTVTAGCRGGTAGEWPLGRGQRRARSCGRVQISTWSNLVLALGRHVGSLGRSSSVFERRGQRPSGYWCWRVQRLLCRGVGGHGGLASRHLNRGPRGVAGPRLRPSARWVQRWLWWGLQLGQQCLWLALVPRRQPWCWY